MKPQELEVYFASQRESWKDFEHRVVSSDLRVFFFFFRFAFLIDHTVGQWCGEGDRNGGWGRLVRK